MSNLKNIALKINLTERIFDFSVNIVQIVHHLPQTLAGKHISVQLLRSGTSCGSNYEEACGAESRADFIHKLSIVLKELKETRFWLKLIKRTKLVKDEYINFPLKECQELCAIIAQSILTARKN